MQYILYLHLTDEHKQALIFFEEEWLDFDAAIQWTGPVVPFVVKPKRMDGGVQNHW